MARKLPEPGTVLTRTKPAAELAIQTAATRELTPAI